MIKKIEDLKIKIFSDGADKKDMLDMNSKTFIKGLTTNPSLMKKAGIKDYEAFAKDILSTIKKNLYLLRFFLMILMIWKDRQ